MVLRIEDAPLSPRCVFNADIGLLMIPEVSLLATFSMPLRGKTQFQNTHRLNNRRLCSDTFNIFFNQNHNRENHQHGGNDIEDAV